MATRPVRETWAHTSSTKGVYTQTEVSCLTNRQLVVATSMMKDETNLHIEDFKSFDGENQAVHDLVGFLSKGTWGWYE